jgi:hypothetical protein
MNIKSSFKNIGWVVAISFMIGSFAAGIILMNRAGETVEPPSKEDVKLAGILKTRSRKKDRKKLKKKAPEKRKLINKKSKPLKSSLKSKTKITLPTALGKTMPGTGNRPLELLNKKDKKDKREERAKTGKEYDDIKKQRRLKRDKRRFKRMPDRISRLEKRLEVLNNDGNKSAQADRLKKSIARLKTRKEELERRLQDEGELE